MLRKIFFVLAIACFVIGFTSPGVSIAGEKTMVKAHGVSYTTAAHQFEVGDEEGHIIVIYENSSIFANEVTGDKWPDRGVGFIDINPNKPAEMYMVGYGVHTDKDGDKFSRSFKGRPIAKGQWKGEYTVTGGTGKFKGATGGGTFISTMLAPNQSYVEVEGEYEMP